MDAKSGPLCVDPDPAARAPGRQGADARRGQALALLAAACWGGAAVMSKSALGEIPPVTLLVLQLAASVATLWTIVLLRRTPRSPWREILRFSWLGLLEPGLAYLVGLFGLRGAPVSSAALIQALESVLILAISAILFRDYPKARVVVLSLLALVALAVALGLWPPVARRHDEVGAELILCAAAVIAALYGVLTNRIAARGDAIYIIAWQQTAALAFSLLALAGQALHGVSPIVLPNAPGRWAIALGSGVIQYAAAFSLSLASLRYIGLAAVGASLTLIPVFAIAAAWVFLGESLPLLQGAGAVATVALVGLISLAEAGGRGQDPRGARCDD